MIVEEMIRACKSTHHTFVIYDYESRHRYVAETVEDDVFKRYPEILLRTVEFCYHDYVSGITDVYTFKTEYLRDEFKDKRFFPKRKIFYKKNLTKKYLRDRHKDDN